MIDGAGPFRILRSIIVPQSVAAIIAVSLFHFFFAWNDFFVPLLYLASKPELQPLSIAIQQYNALYAHPADAHPGVGADDDGRAGRRLPARPAGVHARRRRDRASRSERPLALDESEAIDWPVIPDVAWRRGIGVPCPDVGHPRVAPADDRRRRVGRRPDRRSRHGEHRAHVPRRRRALASRGRDSTAFEPVAADGFSLFVAGPDGVAARDRPLDPPAGGAAGAGAGTCRSAAGPITRSSRGRGRRSSPTPSASASSASSSRPVIARRPRASALPVGVFEWWVENPGPDPLTVGLLFTWADPLGEPGPAAPRRHVARGPPTAGRGRGPVRRRRRRSRRPALRGIAGDRRAWPRDGVDAHARERASMPSPTRSCGPTSRPMDGSTRRDGAAEPGPTARPTRRRGRGDGRPRARASGGRSGSPSRGTCRWSSSGRAAAGGSATRATGAATGTRAWDLARPRPRPRRRPGARRSRPGRRPILDDPEPPGLVQGGPVQRAVLPRRRRDVLGGTARSAARSRTATTSGRFALLECVDYPFYDTVDVDFYASFAMLELFPELELRGHPRPARDDPGRRPDDRHDRGVGRRRRPQGRRHASPTTSAGPTTTRSTAPTGTASRTSTAGRTSGPSSCSRSGATPWPPGRTAMPSSASVSPTVERRPAAASRRAIATATACPSTTASRPDLRHLADARAVGLRRVAVAGGARPRPRRWPSGSGDRRRPRALVGLVRAWPGRLRPTPVARRPLRLRRRRRPELGHDHGRPAGRPVVRRRDRSRRPRARATASRRRCGRSTRTNVCGSRAAGWARSTGCARRHRRRVERAVGRGLGRHDLRAGGVHDRPRARRRRAGRRPRARPRSPTSAACGSGRPRRTTRTATSGRRSTCGRWRSGRSRRRCGADDRADRGPQAGSDGSSDALDEAPDPPSASSSRSYEVA